MKHRFTLITFAALAALSLPLHAWNSAKVQYGSNGRLAYPADASGNRIPDFSHAGYKGGGVALPASVPVRLTVSPITGDDTANIQAAIDAVGAMPVQADGYRGTVLLSAGVYDIAGTLLLNRSGVVLAGVGDGSDPSTATILRRTGTSQNTIIIAGTGSDDQFKPEIAGTRHPIVSPRVRVGSYVVTVDDASGFAVGDNVVVYHPSTAAWIAAMDQGGVTDANVWQPGQIDIRYQRYITAISGNTLVLDAPVFNHLDRGLSQSYVYKSNRTVVTNVGIEDLLVDIGTAGPTSEDHAENAIEFIGAENSWIRDCTAQHFWHAGVQFVSSTRCTVERVRAIDPNSIVTGERRYNFSTYHAQLILFRDCFASYARHAFVANGTSLDSGNVVLNGTIDHNLTFAEAHRRWSTGLLFDGIVAQNRSSGDVLGFYNRGNYGTGHGWAAGASVIWNCNAAGGRILVQQPPTAQNYAIGCFGNVTGNGPFAGPPGYMEGTGQAGLQPQSLYLEQLAQRQNGAPPPDVQAPTAPTNLTAGTPSTTAVPLSWSASTDNVGVDGYDVFDGGVFVGSASGTTFTVTGLVPASTHTFTVSATDAAGNVSALSAPVTVTVAGVPPPPPIVLESENLTYVPTGASASVAYETNPSPSNSQIYASNFHYVSLGADGVPPPPNGEYIDFTLPNIPAGTYDLLMRYKVHPNRGILRMFVDGDVLGTDLDERAARATFTDTRFGVVRFPTAGDHVVRLAVVGKNAASPSYAINSDVFTLIPDTTPPVIAPIADITVEAEGPNGTAVNFTGSAVDNNDGSVPVTFNPASGSVFPVGSTVVTATAKDSAGNIGLRTFLVNVVDTTPPVLTLPADQVLEATSPDGAVANFTASAYDLVDGSVPVSYSQSPGTVFPLRTTTVTVTAQDDYDNVATGTFTVTVKDTTPPAIQKLTASPNVLWPANHKMVSVTLTAVVKDLVDRTPVTRIVSVASNEPANGTGDGNTSSDWALTGPLSLDLRAERSGNGTGRIYTITVESRDFSNNVSTATVMVTVPHDKGG